MLRPRRVRLTRALLLAAALLCAACVQPPPSTRDAARAARLEDALLALPGTLTPGDAARLARGAFDAEARLHARYRPLRPPQLGNLAFHLGLRDRALCCHWVQDLLRELSALELGSVTLHWGVAHLGSRLREHSAVVAVPHGGAFERGLVLDLWRNSGRLHFARVDQDRYPWQPHPSDAIRHRLACGADR